MSYANAIRTPFRNSNISRYVQCSHLKKNCEWRARPNSMEIAPAGHAAHFFGFERFVSRGDEEEFIVTVIILIGIVGIVGIISSIIIFIIPLLGSVSSKDGQ